MTEEEKKKIEEAVSIILRGIDIESSALILESYLSKQILDSVVTDFRFNEEFNCNELWLQLQPLESLQEYRN